MGNNRHVPDAVRIVLERLRAKDEAEVERGRRDERDRTGQLWFPSSSAHSSTHLDRLSMRPRTVCRKRQRASEQTQQKNGRTLVDGKVDHLGLSADGQLRSALSSNLTMVMLYVLDSCPASFKTRGGRSAEIRKKVVVRRRPRGVLRPATVVPSPSPAPDLFQNVAAAPVHSPVQAQHSSNPRIPHTKEQRQS